MSAVLFEENNGTAIVTINRPDKLNSIDEETLGILEKTVKKLHQTSVRSVIITGSGDKAFCAGVDVQYLNKLEGDAVGKFVDRIHALLFDVEKIDKPVIAAVNGYCLGGGCELAMSCDLRIASSKAKFGQPEVKLGIIPGAGGTQRMPKLIGISRAKELIFTGRTISAQTALQIGLVNEIVDPTRVLQEALKVAGEINKNSHNAVKNAKLSLNSSSSDAGYKVERVAFVDCFGHKDKKEGMEAFLEKREPNFS